MDKHVYPQEIFVGVDALAVFFCRIELERMFRLFLQGWAGTGIFGFGWWLIPRVRRAERLRTGTGTGYDCDLFCIVRVHRCMVDLYGSTKKFRSVMQAPGDPLAETYHEYSWKMLDFSSCFRGKVSISGL